MRAARTAGTPSADARSAFASPALNRSGHRPLTTIASSRVFSYLSAAAPGLTELVTIGTIWELAQLERLNPRDTPYDLVIVDAPASGHGIGMLTTPRTFGEIARVGPIRRQAYKVSEMLRANGSNGAVAAALSVHERVKAQRAHLRRLQAETDVPVTTLPFVFESELELEHYRRLAAELLDPA